jgi:hypothetical protein
VATISNTGKIQTTTADIVSGGNIYSNGIYDGKGYIYTTTGDIQTANGDIYTSNGSLRSRGLTIQNATPTPTTTATITTAGAITGTSLSAGTGIISTSGAINGGAITGTSLSAGTGVISTSGAINGGAITGTSLSAGTGIISTSGAINGGAITGTSLSAGTGIISTSGAINGGAITGTSLSAGTGVISTSGAINGGAITGTTLTSSTLNGLTCQGLIVKNGTTTNASLNNLGALTCKAIQNNGNTLGCGNITCARINTTDNQIDCGSGTVFAGIFSSAGDSVLNSGLGSSRISIGSNQDSGIIDIGMNGTRTGDINIGYASIAGSINIGRPIRMPAFIYTNGLEIGYTQNTNVTYSTSTGTGTVSGTRKITTLPVTNLINNANYLVNYSLQIDPIANFNATKLQFGIYKTSIFTDPIPNLSQNLHMLSGSTGATTTRYITSELYCYSGSGFLKYNSSNTYSFSHIMTFTGTVPTINVNIDLIRIS